MATKQTEPAEHDELYKPVDVAEICNVNPETVYRWLRTGKLKGTKLGRRLWRVSLLNLTDFLNNNGKGAA